MAIIAGSQIISTGVERLQGYRFALQEAEIDVHHDWIGYGEFDTNQGYAELKRMMALDNPPEAIFVANDAMMIGVLHAIHDLKISVPDDIGNHSI